MQKNPFHHLPDIKFLVGLILILDLLCIPLFSQAWGRESAPLTLDQAKAMALENNPSPAAALERIRQAREEVAQARAAFGPTLTSNLGYNYTEAVDAPAQDETKHTAQVTATQVLFDGFYRKYAALSAQYGEEIQTAALEEAQRLLSWSVSQAFVNVHLARENIRIAQSDMDFNQEQEQEAALKQKLGTGSLSDRLNFQTKVISARSTLADARQEWTAARIGLAALLGFADARLPGGLELAPLPQPGDAGVQTDLKELADQRPDLRQSRLNVDQAQAQVKMAQSEFYPTLSLTGGYGTTSGDHTLDTGDMGASIGLSVNITLFDGGSRTSKVRQARARKKELEATLKSDELTAMSQLRTGRAKIATARGKLDLQKENTQLILKTRNLVEKEYQAGQVSLVRLNEAQNNLVTAQGNLAMARADLALALEEFDYYSGGNIPARPDQTQKERL